MQLSVRTFGRQLATLAAVAVFVSAPLTARQAPAPPQIQWMTNLEEALRLAAKNNRKVLVDIYAPWCGWCKIMQQRTYSDPAVIRYVNAKYYAVRLDGESRDTIRFQGQDFYFSDANRANQLAYLLMNGRVSYPTTVFMSNKSEVLSPVPGYMDAKTMDKMLRFFGENYYLATNWADFAKEQ